VSWLSAAAELARAGIPFVLVTLARVRGHAPRRAGSKMVVTARETHGSVGGGNLEATATARARGLLLTRARDPELLTLPLTPQGGEHGVQCCGGEVTLLLEPCDLARPSVALFGAGHVGWALVQVLGALPLELHLIDSRAGALERPLPSPLAATVVRHHAPVPESALAALPEGTHLLIMTHDHAEDLAVLECALRGPFGFIGLIGSASKWAHFRRELARQGLSETDLARVVTPIGRPELGKNPPAIAIGVAAQLLGALRLPEGLF
jgi:xanthine dehydrogenase accessory factor